MDRIFLTTGAAGIKNGFHGETLWGEKMGRGLCDLKNWREKLWGVPRPWIRAGGASDFCRGGRVFCGSDCLCYRHDCIVCRTLYVIMCGVRRRVSGVGCRVSGVGCPWS